MRKQVLSEMENTIKELQHMIDSLQQISLDMDEVEEKCVSFDQKIIQETTIPAKRAHNTLKMDWDDEELKKEYEKYSKPRDAAKWRENNVPNFSYEVDQVRHKMETVLQEYREIIDRGGVIKHVK